MILHITYVKTISPFTRFIVAPVVLLFGLPLVLLISILLTKKYSNKAWNKYLDYWNALVYGRKEVKMITKKNIK